LKNHSIYNQYHLKIDDEDNKNEIDKQGTLFQRQRIPLLLEEFERRFPKVIPTNQSEQESNQMKQKILTSNTTSTNQIKAENVVDQPVEKKMKMTTK
jgi:hypothetical protein